VRYSTRSAVSRSETDNTNFRIRAADILQEMNFDEPKLVNAPICINGNWFLPATAGQSEQLDALWAEGRDPHSTAQ
jgi:hypothetical protein